MEVCCLFLLFCSTFGMVDSEETCIVVMVYNTADSWGVLIGDTVVIPEPQVKRHSIMHKDEVSVSHVVLKCECPSKIFFSVILLVRFLSVAVV